MKIGATKINSNQFTCFKVKKIYKYFKEEFSCIQDVL